MPWLKDLRQMVYILLLMGLLISFKVICKKHNTIAIFLSTICIFIFGYLELAFVARDAVRKNYFNIFFFINIMTYNWSIKVTKLFRILA